MSNYNTNASEPRSQSYYDDEIDLLELFAVLWRGKWLIIGVTACIGLIAFFAVKSMPSVYRIETTLNSTSQYDVQALQPSNLKDGSAYQVEPLEVETIYATGLAHAASLYVKKSFWEAKTGQTLTPRTSGATLTDNDLAFKRFVDGLQVIRPDRKDDSSLSRLTLETENPGEDVELLLEYVKFADRYTISQFVGQLRTGYETNLSRLVEDSEARYQRETVNLEDELVRVDEAYRLAKSLGITKTPYEQVQNVRLSIMDSRMYLMGAAVLGEEMKALKARQDMPLEAFVPGLRNMQHWRSQVESDLRKLEVADKNVRAFVVVSPPESSLGPVKPNKLLIFIASIFGAGMLGVLLVFVQHGVKSYQSRQPATFSSHDSTD